MWRSIKQFFDGRIEHHDIVLFSSFLYLLCAMSLDKKDPMIVSFLFLVFLTSIFYHSYPRNIYFRMADWIASLSFIYYIASFIYHNNFFHSLPLEILFFSSILAIISWFVSFFAFLKSHTLVYNISHTLWHLMSSTIIYFIVLSI